MNSAKTIRVLVVEDSSVIARIIAGILNKTDDIEVIGIAKDGEQAVSMTQQMKPDLITMDINLPKINGYEATKQIMAFTPTPILVVSSASYLTETNLTFNAMYYGALDMIEKGKIEKFERDVDFETQLLEKVRLLSKVKVISHPMGRLEKVGFPMIRGVHSNGTFDVFVVGVAASTGGPPAIMMLLKKLPEILDFCMLIIQHIVPSFTEGFAEWLASESNRDVKVAKSGDLLAKNQIFVAPGDGHMTISKGGRIVISRTPPYKGHRPSANVLFSSFAEVAGNKCLGVILSGMGNDGLEGLMEMRKKFAPIIAQDEESCVVFGMPKACIDAGIVTSVSSSFEIADEIIRLKNIAMRK
ncbi:MAG: chemotaxis-specific protein-glutamate methyltransferase CheB [Candidatus Aureabacteria bacterium]|nr:chemotaxis-specific protein-glutamate methyltransferase CheB [Candidatus Auribacterota bacterium]